MKKVGLMLLCSFILFGVCGCGKDSLSGTYKIYEKTEYNEINQTIELYGTLKLFDNGTCTVERLSTTNGKYERLVGDGEWNDCNYSVLDNIISIKYRENALQTYNNEECTIIRNGLICDYLANISNDDNTWKKQ